MIPPKIAPPPLSVIVPNIAAPIVTKRIPRKHPMFGFGPSGTGPGGVGFCGTGVGIGSVGISKLPHNSFSVDRFTLYLPLL